MALLIVIAVLVVGSVLFFSRDWLPVLASLTGEVTDSQLSLNLILLGVVFVCAQLALGLFVWKYRDRGRPQGPFQTQPSWRTELIWLVVAASIFLGLNLAGTRMWAAYKPSGPSSLPDPVRVEVTAVQFRWYFRYPGPDGVFGHVDASRADASLGDPLGLDRTDPASADDQVSSVLLLPAGREAELTLRAPDVIHSFFVPALRFKQDAVPGMNIQVHVTPAQTGQYEIQCAELCGVGHHQMNARLLVVPPAEFDRFLSEARKK
ncbi:MAG: cytochrome c oxidase subunit II [Acidobacteriales bacterium]|nr:cytochrome c oxidase subunit II [Terriglobales bacterium]